MAGTLLAAACGPGAPGAEEPDVEVSARQLVAGTEKVYFTFQRAGSYYTDVGAEGSVAVAGGATFGYHGFHAVGEGVRTARAYGLKAIQPGAVPWLGLTSFGIKTGVSVAGGAAISVDIPTEAAGSDRFGVVKYLLDPDYTFAAGAANAGAVEDTNHTTGGACTQANDEVTFSALEIHADAATSRAAPVGLLATNTTPWPAPASWGQAITLATGDDGCTPSFFIIAKPGAFGHDIVVAAASGDTDLVAAAFVRLGGSGRVAAGADTP